MGAFTRQRHEKPLLDQRAECATYGLGAHAVLCRQLEALRKSSVELTGPDPPGEVVAQLLPEEGVSAQVIPQLRAVSAHETPQARAHRFPHRDDERALDVPGGTTSGAVQLFAIRQVDMSRTPEPPS